ncbi:MAG: hypothetical protein ACOYS2_01020 [Patescibacteria group bacterium]
MISNLAEEIKKIAEATGSEFPDSTKEWAKYKVERPFKEGKMEIEEVITAIKGKLSRGYEFKGEAERSLRTYLERLK